MEYKIIKCTTNSYTQKSSPNDGIENVFVIFRASSHGADLNCSNYKYKSLQNKRMSIEHNSFQH